MSSKRKSRRSEARRARLLATARLRAVRASAVATALALALIAAACGGSGQGEGSPAPVEAQAADGLESESTARTAPAPTMRVVAESAERVEFGRHPHRTLMVREGARISLHDEPGGRPVERLGARTGFHSPTVLSVVAMEDGWAGVPLARGGNDELLWVELDPERLVGGSTPWSLVVRLGERRAELRLGDRLVDEFAVEVGRPGAETPTGRFAVTDTFMGDLNPVYGCCAVAITARQPTLPSGWLGGDVIAIHGNPEELGGAGSAGCVRAADANVRELVERLWPGDPVIVEA